MGDGVINNYGLIEHGIVAPGATPNENAKTYITSNQLGGNFAGAFNASSNKIGTVNLPWSLKDKVDNVSISAALSDGFVSVTVASGVKALTYTAVGSKVNTVVVNGGVETIGAITGIKYLEINQPNTEIAITENLEYSNTAASDKSLSGLVILSDVKVNQGKTVAVQQATYLGADLYVGGVFQHVTGTTAAAATATDANWSGYYGNTTANFASKYITY